MDFASVCFITTNSAPLFFSLHKWVVVTDADAEKLCASTAPSVASPKLIAEALWLLPAMESHFSFSESPSDRS